MADEADQSIWSEQGKDLNYEAYRNHPDFNSLREWMDRAYYVNGLNQYLDSNYLDQLRNHDFYARLWELELAENLSLTGLQLIPTNGSGPDFLVQTSSSQNIWVEAVLCTPDEELSNLWNKTTTNGLDDLRVYDFPKTENGLRYASSLYTKAIKYQKYIEDGRVGPEDILLIALSGFPPGALHGDIEHFMQAAFPLGDPVVHINRDGSPLDPTVHRSTHTSQTVFKKANGSEVLKEFLYPGDHFPYIDGVLFTEASNLQQLLGSGSTRFNESTNTPHVFLNFASTKKIDTDFTDFFYLHVTSENTGNIIIEQTNPLKEFTNS